MMNKITKSLKSKQMFK